MAERLMRRREIDPETKCWNWTGYVGAEGYGQIRLPDGPTSRETHRVAYEVLVGPIPSGLVLDHLCRNRACFNPEHLEPVTNRVNILRGEGKSAINARKSHCERGHELTPENVYTNRGARVCKTCHKAATLRYRRSLGILPRAPKVECKWGHDLTEPANIQTINSRDGQVRRTCRACDRRRGEEYRARKAAAIATRELRAA